MQTDEKEYFFEYHFHGCAGHKTTELNRTAYEEMSRYLLQEGQTDGFLATFSAATIDSLVQCLEFCGQLMEEKPLPGARLAGVYLEGPFVHIAGGMTEDLLVRPNLRDARRLLAAGRNIIKNVTVAPELPGAMEVIEFFASEGIPVSAGHFYCPPEILQQAISCGVTSVTHFCSNGEGPLENHFGRYSTEGSFLEILADDRLTTEVICDGVHVDPRLVRTIYRTKGPERFLAITDGCAATGIPGKRLWFPNPAGVQEEFEVKNGALYIADTDRLTGSIATMKRIYRNLMDFCGISHREAFYACSDLPRRRVGEQHHV